MSRLTHQLSLWLWLSLSSPLPSALSQRALRHKRQTYLSDTPLTRQISYCFFKGLYHPKDPRHRKELWAKDGYLPCYFIPHKENI
jgi:hypothetical protein